MAEVSFTFQLDTSCNGFWLSGGSRVYTACLLVLDALVFLFTEVRSFNSLSVAVSLAGKTLRLFVRCLKLGMFLCWYQILKLFTWTFDRSVYLPGNVKFLGSLSDGI
jgi:hypothetical protein